MIVLFNEHGPRVKVVYAQVTTKSSQPHRDNIYTKYITSRSISVDLSSHTHTQNKFLSSHSTTKHHINSFFTLDTQLCNDILTEVKDTPTAFTSDMNTFCTFKMIVRLVILFFPIDINISILYLKSKIVYGDDLHLNSTLDNKRLYT